MLSCPSHGASCPLPGSEKASYGKRPGPEGSLRQARPTGHSCILVLPLFLLQASGQVNDPLAPSHLEFKFEPEDFAFPSAALGPQAGLGGTLCQEAWCALALA